MIYRLSLAWPQPQKRGKCSTAAFPKLFTFREVGMQVSHVTMLCPSPRTVAPPPCLPLDIKDSLKEDSRFFDGGVFFMGFLMGDGLIGGLLARMMLLVGC
jgi:hypothetical protein